MRHSPTIWAAMAITIYSLDFDILSTQNPLTASFLGQFTVDDRVTQIKLNGTILFSESEGSDSVWTDFSATSGFERTDFYG
jgi:hypothetical protein